VISKRLSDIHEAASKHSLLGHVCKCQFVSDIRHNKHCSQVRHQLQLHWNKKKHRVCFVTVHPSLRFSKVVTLASRGLPAAKVKNVGYKTLRFQCWCEKWALPLYSALVPHFHK